MQLILLTTVMLVGAGGDTQFDKKAALAALKKQGSAHLQAACKLDAEKFIETVHPAAIKKVGGRKKMLEILRDVHKKLAEIGWKDVKSVVGTPKQITVTKGEVFGILPFTMTYKLRDKFYKGQLYKLGVSENNGKTWKFVRIPATDARKQLEELFPKLPKDFSIPKQGRVIPQ